MQNQLQKTPTSTERIIEKITYILLIAIFLNSLLFAIILVGRAYEFKPSLLISFILSGLGIITQVSGFKHSSPFKIVIGCLFFVGAASINLFVLEMFKAIVFVFVLQALYGH